MAGFSAMRADVYDRVSRSQYYRDNLAGLTAHQRHQRLLAELQKGAAPRWLAECSIWRCSAHA
jgi:hypothetical protein